MIRHAVFLRGINVGGNKKVPMAQLKVTLENMGLTDVKTLLASGNAMFSAKKENIITLTKRIAAALEKEFGFTIPVLMREMSRLEEMFASEPFKAIKVTKDIRLYVTFLSEVHKTKLKIPYTSDDKAIRILKLEDDALYSVLDLSKGKGTVDAMAIIEKEFGKLVTTRNWNTIEKMMK
ncbi:MAG TPA: DUF1697 domain-containing protein [Candidatus Kapabacteria bacterium]